MAQNIVLHIPHSSTVIPITDGYVDEDAEIQHEINLLTDWFTDELFDLPFLKVVAPFSRIFCDVERFDDDSLEIMAQYGMGMCYTHTDNGTLMRKVSPELRMKIKSEYYNQHHNLLEKLTSETLSKHGQAIIIDCHSYPDMPPYRDLNQELPRPDFCIGTDEFHTPEKLRSSVFDFLIKRGYQVKINNPYSGTLIPMKYYGQNKNIIGIMIEVNRKLYMSTSNKTVLKNKNFSVIKTLINDLIAEICNSLK